MIKKLRDRLRMMCAIRRSAARDAGMSTLEGLILLAFVVAGALVFKSMYDGKLNELISDFNNAS